MTKKIINEFEFIPTEIAKKINNQNAKILLNYYCEQAVLNNTNVVKVTNNGIHKDIKLDHTQSKRANAYLLLNELIHREKSTQRNIPTTVTLLFDMKTQSSLPISNTTETVPTETVNESNIESLFKELELIKEGMRVLNKHMQFLHEENKELRNEVKYLKEQITVMASQTQNASRTSGNAPRIDEEPSDVLPTTPSAQTLSERFILSPEENDELSQILLSDVITFQYFMMSNKDKVPYLEELAKQKGYINKLSAIQAFKSKYLNPVGLEEDIAADELLIEESCIVTC